MNHESQCKICAFGAEDIDWSLSNTAIGEIVECAESSVRRHRKWAEANGFRLSATSAVTGNHEFPESDVPGSWIPRRHWQTPNGEVLNSFQFVPDSAGVEVKVDNDRIDSLISVAPTPVGSPNSGRTAILVLADPQLGKAGEQGGGTPETIERIYASVGRALETYRNNPPEEIWLVDGGDQVENVFSASGTQVSTNDRTVPEQIEDYIAVSMNVLGQLLNTGARVHHVTVTSNHSEARTSAKVNPYGSENDWGLMMQRMIAAKCDDRGWDVSFHRPDHMEDTAVFDTSDGTRIAVNHGHHSGTSARVKQWVTGQIVGQRPGHDAHHWILNHFHHGGMDTVGNGKIVFRTPAIDPGSAWFTRKTGESFPPGMLGFDVDNGNWSNLTIF